MAETEEGLAATAHVSLESCHTQKKSPECDAQADPNGDPNVLSMVPIRCRSGRNRAATWTLLSSFLQIEDVPEYLRVNPRVLGGYRREMSWEQALQTIFLWHNETLNIWSHLLGTLCFVCLLLVVATIPPLSPIFVDDLDNISQMCWTPTQDDLPVQYADWPAPKWPLLIFDLTAIYALSISTLFHTCLCISKSQFQFWRKMDFTGILVVMFGMYWPFCYYSFDCVGDDHKWFVVYVSVAGGVAAACLMVVLLPVFQSNKFHVYRPLIFGLMILWGFTPVLHIAVVDWGVCAIRAAVILTMTMFALTITGGLFYVTRWPERVLHPKKLSPYSFHSHFLFHVCVVVGLVIFHVGNVVLYNWRNSLGGCPVR